MKRGRTQVELIALDEELSRCGGAGVGNYMATSGQFLVAAVR